MLCNESSALNDEPKGLDMTDLRGDRYLEPGRATTVFNSAVAWLARAGVSIVGSRELRVRGRRSGEWRTTPVNLLVVDGQRYLVAPRGQTRAGRPSGSATSGWPAAENSAWAAASSRSAPSSCRMRTSQ